MEGNHFCLNYLPFSVEVLMSFVEKEGFQERNCCVFKLGSCLEIFSKNDNNTDHNLPTIPGF